MHSRNILLVEDDFDLLEIMAQFLEGNDFVVFRAETLSEGVRIYENESVDLVLLDIILPDGSGLDLLKKIRKTDATPVILMTSLGKDSDVVDGLSMGANDYISKPSALEVVYARIKTHLMLSTYDMRTDAKHGALRLDKAISRAYLNGLDLGLTPKEFILLRYFFQHALKTITSEQLYHEVWGMPLNNNTTALRSHIYSLRQKLQDENNSIIETTGKSKYVFHPENLPPNC